jgi:hypothetical protein
MPLQYKVSITEPRDAVKRGVFTFDTQQSADFVRVVCTDVGVYLE